MAANDNKPNMRPKGGKSGPQGTTPPKRDSKGQDSRKVHDTKGKNTHGRNN